MLHSSPCLPRLSRLHNLSLLLLLPLVVAMAGCNDSADADDTGGDIQAEDTTPPGDTEDGTGDTAEVDDTDDGTGDAPEAGDAEDEEPEPDGREDWGERDPEDVARQLERVSVNRYLEEITRGAELDICAPVQPVGREQCSQNSECDDGFVCRDVVQAGWDSQCTCIEEKSCDNLTCGPGQVCVPGTGSIGILCGSGGSFAYCTDTCVAGTCISDSDCDPSEQCIFVLGECDNFGSLACTPREGTGCLGIEDACPAGEECRATRSGDWQCMERPSSCG